jgi:2-keto-3-deoxy-L-fuconate dehydrogenase
MSRLAEKTCIVTGAGAGIGFETARAFMREGATVIALDRDDAGLAALRRDCPAVATRVLDVTDNAAVTAFFGTVARVDVLFNCAGMVSVGNLLDGTPEEWRRSFDLNVTAIFAMCRAAVPLMRAQGGGSIINMGSVISSIGAAPDRCAYGATKAAVIGLTKSIALDFAADGVRCNAICPSGVETPSMTARIDAMQDPAAARTAFESRQPVGRMARPDEVAEMAIYLGGDMSEMITGTTMIMDGGAKL